MAKYYGSPWGTIRGKIGEAVGASWRGTRYVRSHAGKLRNHTPTTEQMSNRARFKAATQYVKLFNALFVQKAVAPPVRGTSARNRYMRHVYHALEEIQSGTQIWQVKKPVAGLCSGPYDGLKGLAASQGAGAVELTWDVKQGAPASDASHHVSVVLLNAECTESVEWVRGGTRGDKKLSVPYGSEFTPAYAVVVVHSQGGRKTSSEQVINL